MTRLIGGRKVFRAVILLAVSVLFSACGGGGGGGGGEGGGSGSVEDGTERTSGTGVRIIHAALDIEPVDLKIGLDYAARAAFMDIDFMTDVKSGTTDVAVERANSPGVNYYFGPLTLAPKTEYTFLLSGESSHNNFNVTVLEEPVVRPDEGKARIQLINLLEGSSPLNMAGPSLAIGPVPFRLASGYADIGVGPQTFTVTNSRGGVISTFTTDVANQGELTIVVGGYAPQGVIVTRIVPDLD